MARTARRKGKTSTEPEMKTDYDGLAGHHPPPPPDMDPIGTAGYASYAPSGSEYGSHDLSGPVGSPGGGRLGGASPHSHSRAYFPTGATTGASSDYSVVDDHIHHVQHLPPISEALHPDEKYGYGSNPSSYDTAHQHGGDSSGHPSYDQGSNNFFDSNIMEAPIPPGTADSRHGSIHATNGNGNAGHYSTTMMTPPPVSASIAHGGYANSSPYQPTPPSTTQMFHRASISGPVMHSHYPPPAGTPHHASTQSVGGTPASTNDMATWGTPSGSARPHTADGMFGSQLGSLPPQWSASNMSGPADYNRAARTSNASMTSLQDGQSSSGKVFSYMPNNGDDTSSVGESGSQSGSGARKRPRRRFDEIERLYNCSWAGCQKSYGTLNHLNAHVAMQKHGSKRSPGEFKEMRKAWRKSKREDEQRRQANIAAANEEALSRNKMMFAPTSGPSFMPHGGYQISNFGPPSGSASGPPAPHVMPPPGQLPRYSMHPQQQNTMYGSPVSSGVYPSHVSPFDPNGRGYTSSSPHQQNVAPPSAPGTSGLGAYLMAHRGSI